MRHVIEKLQKELGFTRDVLLHGDQERIKMYEEELAKAKENVALHQKRIAEMERAIVMLTPFAEEEDRMEAYKKTIAVHVGAAEPTEWRAGDLEVPDDEKQRIASYATHIKRAENYVIADKEAVNVMAQFREQVSKIDDQ